MKIISTIAAKWEKFGILLDFDETGRILDRIAKDHPSDAERCCTQMMKEWLEGRGRQPATWATLIDLLKDADINDLTQQLEMMVEGDTTAGESEVEEGEDGGEGGERQV